MLPTGTTLGPYQILALLGKGGMGEVYRARDTRLGRDVAVKVIGAGQAHGDTRRFAQEARAAGALNHPNVCAVFDIGTHEGSPFVVMELLEGLSLRVPPLRERRNDIPLLAAHILERLARRDGLPATPALSESALTLLMAHGGALGANHLPAELRDAARTAGQATGQANKPSAHTEEERELLVPVLREANWHRTRAARQQGMDRSTLWRKIREYGLRPEDQPGIQAGGRT